MTMAATIGTLSLELLIVVVVFPGLEDLGETVQYPLVEDTAGSWAWTVQFLGQAVGSLCAEGSRCVDKVDAFTCKLENLDDTSMDRLQSTCFEPNLCSKPPNKFVQYFIDIV